jgi:hypothetical protein
MSNNDLNALLPTGETLGGSDDASSGTYRNSSAPPAGGGSAVAPSSTQEPADLMAEAVQGAHNMIDSLAQKAAPYLHRLGEDGPDTGDMLADGLEHLGAMHHEWADSLRGSVRANPLASVGTALVLGMLISRVTR